MYHHTLNSTNLRMSASISTPPTTCSTKFVTERTRHKPIYIIRSLKRSQETGLTGLQIEPKKSLSRILWTDAAIEAIERKANSKKYKKLWPKAVLEALDEALRANRWVSALKILGLLRMQHWYAPRCQTYTKVLMMLGRCKQPEQASLLFQTMLSEGLRPTIDVYTALVSAYGESGLLEKAILIVDDMKSVSDCIPDVYTYSILIKSCCKFNRFDLIKEILAEMSYLGIECSTVTYNIIIDGYGKAKMFEEMENSLLDMIETGSCLPDIYTLNSVIGAYGNSGHIEKMERWYDEFQLMNILPDIKTFNIMIRSYGKAGMYKKMISVMKFMENRFFSPTIVTYNIVIEVLGWAGNIEEMDEYFKRMKHLGMKPNCITYCSLVSAYSKAGLIMSVDSILRQVENSDVILDTPFYNCIISAYGQAGDVDKMEEMFMAMKERNCMPDDITFATMIQAYNAQGMIEDAQDLEKKIFATKDCSGISHCIFTC
ncbi:PPR domain-containing protein/PPR_2 domain-containing protein/PPR_3 domain-containing protein [Cephalotus follicularis]|uniref:PPR domain-containing protein/PPR_2 domain-containing protein/PPR_3 domain-containing protein n=1 Tax=Cephalotus follicularis TaxID=3775 RepID=A0A1Q3DBE9_CEPFO|nr:PPR domain-containing protein/PPR_2 domain-containing protein/PPR_3 domain-containing protein [Cephalotus follicularis]